ncbi:MAG: hypothetical protein ACLFWF_03055 [Alphaproteobacteria bacterium]
MTAVRKLREAIDETADRWESAAASLETCIASPRPAIARRAQSLRQEAARTAGRLRQVLEEARELAPEARERVVTEIDQFRNYLNEGGAGETESLRIKKIKQSRQRLEKCLGCIAEDVHPDFEQAVSDWLRAQMELETGLDLMARRLACERAGNRAQLEARKPEILQRIEHFRNLLKERRVSAARRGRPFGPEMSAAYQKLCNTFQHPAG